ncbi:Protein F26A3.7 [Aphelenchoides avenae]|nr:Protein F26A3.7 [Aphelenchus avenae]
MELPIEEEDDEATARNGVKPKAAEDDDEEDMVGPMPPPPPEKSAEEEAEYFRRLMEFEAKQAENSSLKREEWMTELPKKMKANYGLSARTFSRSNAPSGSGGAAAWTATPNGKPKAGPSKPEPEEILAAKRNEERDRAEERKAAALNEGRQESLMEQHKRKRKGDNDDSAASSGVLVGGRRTFNRDSDMEVRGLSVSAEEVKKRMGSLNNRFGHGSSQKFL